MSSVSQTLGNQQALTNYDVSKIFIWNNRFETDNYANNSNYTPATWLAGTLMGRVASSGYLVPLISGALDGSTIPVGILAHNITVAGGAVVQVTICIAGDVAAEKVIYAGGDNANTVINGRSLKDRIQGDTAGIILRSGTEMTDYDNQ